MGKFSAYRDTDASKTAKSKGSNLRVHYKNTRETANALKGMGLKRAQKYLEDVIAHKDIVPFRRFTGGPGHKAQCKRWKAVSGRWPEKSCRYLLDLLQNAESNAEVLSLKFTHSHLVSRLAVLMLTLCEFLTSSVNWLPL